MIRYGFSAPIQSLARYGFLDGRHRLFDYGCERLGAAVDFLVEDENMLEVAQWVAANTPFDRLYFYGEDQPIHVSYGPNHDRQIVRMSHTKEGRLVPRVCSREGFLAI